MYRADPRSERALKNVAEMLDTERPDLVIHTGDVIFGKPAEASLREILSLIADRKIPFAVTLGNHDEEFGKNRREVFDIIRSIPCNINTPVKEIYGVSNDIITLSSATDDTVKWVFYLFDSNRHSKLPGIKGYDYIHFDQIAWYRNHSQAFTKRNGGTPVPSLAFFHIPLPEYNYATRLDTRRVMKGNFGEEPYSPHVNSGLFVSLKEMGDVQAILCGHDHDNDYAMQWNGMFLMFGRFGGCDTVYNDLKPSGARVIELTEGEPGFRSWIRNLRRRNHTGFKLSGRFQNRIVNYTITCTGYPGPGILPCLGLGITVFYRPVGKYRHLIFRPGINGRVSTSESDCTISSVPCLYFRK